MLTVASATEVSTIWNHLGRQSVDHGRTVIVTTLYIEESRQANTIGVMRSGRLLVEVSPENLLRMIALSSLEGVFLKLCIKDDNITSGEVVFSPAWYAADLTQFARGGSDNMSSDEISNSVICVSRTSLLGGSVSAGIFALFCITVVKLII